ncbi:MAG TPA: peptidylprolyl isomerase [Steroidobacteraceae bacterium]|jgi:cyclophilin family peptidyl-prolyl cis-trans isomerase|nr:peptidylprolyl isomerase [Steroidobacteraceae bacterium]
MRARHRTLTLRLAFALAAGFACLLLVQHAARADDATSSNPEVRVTTNMGSFVIELRPDRAPLTVADFLRYVHEGFYTNTLFHRVVANFVIQGGGHDATAPYALKPTYPPIDNESGNGLQNKRGAVGLARAAGAHTGNAQFYINLVDNPELDPLPTRWGYAVFGQVVEGMDVIDRIGVVPTGAFGPLKSDAPLKPVIIQSVEVINPPALSTPASGGTPGGQPSATPPSGTPPSGTSPSEPSPSGAPSSGTPQSSSPQSGSPSSSQPPAANPPAQPGKPGSQPPSGTKPATPPPGTPPAATQSKSSSGEADQPDGTSPQR